MVQASQMKYPLIQDPKLKPMNLVGIFQMSMYEGICVDCHTTSWQMEIALLHVLSFWTCSHCSSSCNHSTIESQDTIR